MSRNHVVSNMYEHQINDRASEWFDQLPLFTLFMHQSHYTPTLAMEDVGQVTLILTYQVVSQPFQVPLLIG